LLCSLALIMPTDGNYPVTNGNIIRQSQNIMQVGKEVMKIANQLGVTLIELMIVIVITAVLMAIGIPAFRDTIDRNRLKAVTDTLYGDFQFSKSEAIKRNQTILVDFTTSGGGATWCYGLKAAAASCDCTETNASAANACVIDNVLKVVKSTDYKGVTMTPSADFTFDNVRGTVNAGNVTLNSTYSKQTRVILSGLGRIRLCSPSGTTYVSGYSTTCP
jgi:type IV fimbrial biogenesis protein FimT